MIGLCCWRWYECLCDVIVKMVIEFQVVFTSSFITYLISRSRYRPQSPGLRWYHIGYPIDAEIQAQF
jgi:hypothetical protein